VAVDTAPGAPVPARRREGEAFAGNILIVSIDALRADRLGVAGYLKRQGKSLTPNLDGLARQGAYFRRAWSQAPNTPRSFPSMLTGRLPSEVTWVQRSLNYSPIAPANLTFFEQLAGAGLRPIGLFSHFYFSADRGLNQGFVEWNNDGAGTIAESNKDIASPRLVPRVIARLKQAAKAGERFVLWTHLFEPHSSYMSHPEYPTSLRGVDGLQEKYDYEIAYVDGWFGKILAALDEAGLRKNTAVLVLADHGEAWGEHKLYFHGQDLTEEQLRVPLILAVPGRKPVVVDDPVALMDVSATLVDLVGLEPPASFRGRSLMPAVDGKTLSARPIFGELLPATAWPKHETMMVDGLHKITHKITDRRWELHDLAADPGQHKDLSRDPKHQARFEELRKKLLSFEETRPAAGK
jgi:choline-sulfatase